MKNPLIPMGAITGDPKKTEIDKVMHLYAQAGIEQFLLYPRSGCEIEYMSDRWIEVCGDVLAAAEREGIDVWLYDEYNWPSGTCRGRVMRENGDFVARSVFVENGRCVVRKNESYADILNAEAVDCFIRNTHEVYYAHFGSYFGRVIKGIFTDEPDLWYCARNGGKYPYTRGLETLYRERFGRDLFAEMAADVPTAEFKRDLMALLGELFRTNYLKRLNDWCLSHGVLLTGHTMAESDVNRAVRTCGGTPAALRCFSLPGIDEILTETAVDKAEWQTLGCAEAAIGTVGKGGLAELFAYGPADLPPARVEQMIWLAAAFGIDHYVLAVSALDARGNVEKTNYFNPMCYTSPWFEGYRELSASARLAAEYAKKSFTPKVAVRYPARETAEALFTEGEKKINERLSALLRALVKNQYGWRLIDGDEPVPHGAYPVEISASEDFSVGEVLSALEKNLQRGLTVLENGALAEELLVKEYDDGDFLILDLKDGGGERALTVVRDGESRDLILPARGHITAKDEAVAVAEIARLDGLAFRLSLDADNLLRCALREDALCFTFEAEETLDGVRLVTRNYRFDGEICLDGEKVLSEERCEQLRKGLGELYRSTAPLRITKGRHTVTLSKPPVGEYYLPSCFLAGRFAADGNRLRKLPETVSEGRLDTDVLPHYAGGIIYEAEVAVPKEAFALSLDGGDLYTRLYLDGVCLGGQLSGYRYEIPSEYKGRTVTLKLIQYTSIAPMFGKLDECVRVEGIHPLLARFAPGKYQRCGVSGLRFVKREG